jgi:hypothetical protein
MELSIKCEISAPPPHLSPHPNIAHLTGRGGGGGEHRQQGACNSSLTVEGLLMWHPQHGVGWGRGTLMACCCPSPFDSLLLWPSTNNPAACIVTACLKTVTKQYAGAQLSFVMMSRFVDGVFLWPTCRVCPTHYSVLLLALTPYSAYLLRNIYIYCIYIYINI